jgi:hypothetical protein
MADRPTVAFGLLLTLATLTMCSCGGAGTEKASVSPSGTLVVKTSVSGSLAAHRRFVGQASDICAGVRAQQEPLRVREEALRKLPVNEADQEFVPLARQAAAIARNADARLGALPRPPADAQAIAQLVRAYSEEAADASSIASAASHRENDVGEAVSAALARSIGIHSASAKSLGMGACFALE